MDPRLATIDKRLRQARKILAVTGGKGGIGKSLVASTLALVLARRGFRAGLLDLDLTAPCDHLILGLENQFPREEFGLEPPLVHGVRFMSLAYFNGDQPAPLRGGDVTNALIELLAITQWGQLDVLVIDMPPGLGDTKLDTIRLLRRAEYLVVATSSPLVLETVRRTLRLLVRLRAAVEGVVENMRRGNSPAVRALAGEFGVPFLGSLPYDDGLDQVLGDPEKLASSDVAAALAAVSARVQPVQI